ncbi:MAG: hypothetical protein ACRCWQ_02035 [Bacilli bacterium]
MLNFGDVIPAGYSVEIVTWENDGDNYQTRWQHGMTLEEAQYVSKILEGMHPMGNEYIQCDAIVEYIIDNTSDHECDMCHKFFRIDAATFHGDESAQIDVYDMLDIYTANGESDYGYDYLRVIERIKIHHFENEIVIPTPTLVSQLINV